MVTDFAGPWRLRLCFGSFLFSLLVVWGGLTACRTSSPVVVAAVVTVEAPPKLLSPAVTPSATAAASPMSSLPVIATRAIALSKTPTPVPSPSPTLQPTPTLSYSVSPARTVAGPGRQVVIGYSYEGRPILSYEFGYGPVEIVFVGGIHGGYEWNTILLAYEAIDYFLAHSYAVPATVTLSIIPSANPDGQFVVTNREGRFMVGDVLADTVPGRFNGRGVDLNRNWDCAWSATAVWRNQAVSGGGYPFSESESRALRDFFLEQQPALVLFWHSAANGVFAAGCPETFFPSRQLAVVYGEAAGYAVHERFTYYPVMGDAGDWLATRGIPSIAVELKTHDGVDWSENLAGMLAVLAYYDRPVRQ